MNKNKSKEWLMSFYKDYQVRWLREGNHSVLGTSSYRDLAEGLAELKRPDIPEPVQNEVPYLAQTLMKLVYKDAAYFADKPGCGGYLQDDFELISHLGKLHRALPECLDTSRFLNFAEKGTEIILRSRNFNYWVKVLDILDNVDFSQDIRRKLAVKVITSLRDNRALDEDEADHLFYSEDKELGGLFHMGRTKEEAVAKLIQMYQVQKQFLPWTRRRFEYHEEEGKYEPAAVIGSLGGLETSLWQPCALRRIKCLLRGNPEGEWYIKHLEYLQEFIRCIGYPKENLVDIAKREIPKSTKERTRFIDWLSTS